jgi:hypothetical protein
MGIQGMDLVHKDSNGGSGFTYLRTDSEKFFPTTVRITMVQVSAGSMYNPALVPGLDGGTVVPEGGSVRDAGTSDSSGGPGDAASGAGGAGGAGGAAAGSGGQAGTAVSGTTGTGGDGTGGATGSSTSSSVSSGAGGGDTTTGAGTTGTAGTTGSSGTTTTSSSSGSGTTTGSAAPADSAGGCSCSIPGRERAPSGLAWVAAAALSAIGVARRRRARTTRAR